MNPNVVGEGASEGYPLGHEVWRTQFSGHPVSSAHSIVEMPPGQGNQAYFNQVPPNHLWKYLFLKAQGCHLQIPWF